MYARPRHRRLLWSGTRAGPPARPRPRNDGAGHGPPSGSARSPRRTASRGPGFDCARRPGRPRLPRPALGTGRSAARGARPPGQQRRARQLCGFRRPGSRRDPSDRRGQPDGTLRLDAKSRAPHAGPGRGEIVEISSVLGFVGLPYSAVYVASKHAVNGLVKSLRYELHGTGVRVWAACPGRTESEFAERAMAVDELKGPVPKGRRRRRSSGRSSAAWAAGRRSS